MKNASLVLNVVLLIAVIVLFYLHFSSGKKADPVKADTKVSTATAPKGDVRIAYFEMDSINNSFAAVKEMRAELSREESRMNNELAQLQKTYNDKFTQYQSQAKTMSSVESEAANRDIVQMQQKFAAAKQQMEQRMQDISVRKMQEVKGKVEDYLKEYNKSKGYTYIIAYEPGFMYYRDSTYDITADLIKGLNETYKKK